MKTNLLKKKIGSKRDFECHEKKIVNQFTENEILLLFGSLAFRLLVCMRCSCFASVVKHFV